MAFLDESPASCGLGAACGFKGKTPKENLKDILSFALATGHEARYLKEGYRFIYWSDVRAKGSKKSPGQLVFDEILKLWPNANIHKLLGGKNPNTKRVIDMFVWRIPEERKFLQYCKDLGLTIPKDPADDDEDFLCYCPHCRRKRGELQ